MKPTHIAIHHSASTDGDTYNWEGIRAYHVGVRGYLDIGYNFGIEMVNGWPHMLIGRLFQGSNPAAHLKGWNDRTLGVCLVGNYSLVYPPAAIREKALSLVGWLQDTYGIPRQNVMGHREFAGAATECPGLKFDMNAFRHELVG